MGSPFSTLSVALSSQNVPLLSLEERLLECYHKISIPYTTFNVNKRHTRIWTKIVPLYFSQSKAIKLCILAAGCLWMMPFMGSHDYIRLNTSLTSWTPDADLHEVCYSELMSDYLLEALRLTQEAITDLQNASLSRSETMASLGSVLTSSAILYGIIGLYPYSSTPLVHFPETGEEQIADFLGQSVALRDMVLQFDHLLPILDVGDLFQRDELNFIPKRKIKIINQMRDELNKHYRTVQLVEINSNVAQEIYIFNECLRVLEKVCALSIKYNYPIQLYQWLLFCKPEFSDYVRKKNPFALRLLFFYACLCIRYRLWILEDNMWTSFVHKHYKENFPLEEFDQRIYNYVVIGRNYTDDDFVNLRSLDIWASEFDSQSPSHVEQI